MSWKRLLSNGIEHWPASNQLSRNLDKRINMKNYVRLCRQPNHPMAHKALIDGRINDFVWLQIDGVVANWQTTRFSSDNATRNYVNINDDPDTALGSFSPQAEILVEGGINVRWIKFPGEWSEETSYFDLEF